MDLVISLGETLPELGRNDPTPAIGGIARDANFHRASGASSDTKRCV